MLYVSCPVIFMTQLVNQLIKDNYLKSDLVIEAFSEINRAEFVPKDLESAAESNVALPIGYGQTISQPLTVAIMLELLDVQRGHRVLDVGSGSGWSTALLSYIVGSSGKVFALERITDLYEVGPNYAGTVGGVKMGIAEFYLGDGSKGYPEEAPYDRILVSAMAKEIPEELKKQLKVGGKMVIPTEDNLYFLEKKSDTEFYEERFPGFAFVPLIIDKE